jgi:Tol biopolymer transport system component
MKRRGNKFKWYHIFGLIFTASLISSCETKSIASTPTIIPKTLPPPSSTATLRPTSSSTPTASPSATPQPTSTPTPSPTVTPTPGPTPQGGGTGFVFFTACKVRTVGQCGLYKIGIDGQGLQEIFPPEENIFGYILSPDQSKVLIQTGPSQDKYGNFSRFDLSILDFATGIQSFVARKVDPTDIKWSPDSSRLAYISYQEMDPPNVEINKLYVVDSDGANKTLLSADLSVTDHWILWTQDSKRILFTGGTPFRILEVKDNHKIEEPLDGSDDPYWSTLYMVNADGNDLTKLPPERQRGFWYAAWVEDGHKILANVDLCPDAGCGFDFVMTIDLDTGQSVKIEPDEQSIDNVALSPDKKHYLSWCTVFSCSIIYNSLDNSEKQEYGRGIYWEPSYSTRSFPVWSPDGQYTAQVAYSDFDNWQKASSALFISDTDNLNKSNRITKWLYRPPAGLYDWFWSWSPDSQYIVYSTPGKPILYLLNLADLDNPNPQVLYESKDMQGIGPIYWQPGD